MEEKESYFIKKAIRCNVFILIISFLSLIWSFFLFSNPYMFYGRDLLPDILVLFGIFALIFILSLVVFIKVCRLYLYLENQKIKGIFLLILSSALLMIILFFIPILVIIPMILSIISLIQLNKEKFKCNKEGEKYV